MPQLIPAEDIRNGDYSPVHGTVVHVAHAPTMVHIKFFNGTLLDVDKGVELLIEEGGRFDHPPEGSIREGLK